MGFITPISANNGESESLPWWPLDRVRSRFYKISGKSSLSEERWHVNKCYVAMNTSRNRRSVQFRLLTLIVFVYPCGSDCRMVAHSRDAAVPRISSTNSSKLFRSNVSWSHMSDEQESMPAMSHVVSKNCFSFDDGRCFASVPAIFDPEPTNDELHPMSSDSGVGHDQTIASREQQTKHHGSSTARQISA